MHILIGGYERKVVLEGDIRKVELEPSFEFVNRVDNCVEADRLVQLLERGGDYTDVGVFRSGREHAANDVFAAFCQTPLNSRNGRGGILQAGRQVWFEAGWIRPVSRSPLVPAQHPSVFGPSLEMENSAFRDRFPAGVEAWRASPGQLQGSQPRCN